MQIGYMRVSTTDQNLDLQVDALRGAGVNIENIYQDKVSGSKSERIGLNACLKALRAGDILIVYSLDRLGRNLQHLIQLINDLNKREISLRVLTGAPVDTTTPHGKFLFSIFASLAEFERALIIERVNAGLKAARARGKVGGAPFKMTIPKLKTLVALIKDKKLSISEICQQLDVKTTTIYDYVSPDGDLRDKAKKLIQKKLGKIDQNF